ncbi:GtrA family protein [Nocardia alni]|uniref:GtrA family protein n=1 Tax=Nocardia alni TaxID=2815723 RepID=UPI0020B45A6F|nr:GtrA family protein [Nocardia alni]
MVSYMAHPGGEVNPESESDGTTAPRIPVAGVRGALGRLGVYLRGDRWLAQLIRFALVGGFSNIGYFLLFMAFYGSGPQLANLTGSVVSTALANELHRRLTFHAADRVGWFTAQIEGGGLALAGLGITSAALALLDVLVPHIGGAPDAIAVILVTAVVGTFRFLGLRLWVFQSGHTVSVRSWLVHSARDRSIR